VFLVGDKHGILSQGFSGGAFYCNSRAALTSGILVGTRIIGKRPWGKFEKGQA
jgi:hypothetical protein